MDVIKRQITDDRPFSDDEEEAKHRAPVILDRVAVSIKDAAEAIGIIHGA